MGRSYFHRPEDIEAVTAHIDRIMERRDLSMGIFAITNERMNHTHKAERDWVYFEAINTPLPDGRRINPSVFCRAISMSKATQRTVSMGIRDEAERRRVARAGGAA